LLLLLFFYYCRKRLILEAFCGIVGFFLLRPKSCFCPRIFCKEKAPDPGAGLILFPQEKCLRRLLLFFCWKRLIWKYLLEACFFSRLPRPAKFCLYLSDFV
jgi:hypothetical protein